MAAKQKASRNSPGKGRQQTLPRPHPSGAELTTELCNLEQQLRKRKADLEKAQAGLDLAKGAVKSAEGEVTKVQDAIAEALYDLRAGQGRIEFPEPDEKAA